MLSTPCQCELAGWCQTHGRNMSATRFDECHNKPGFFEVFAKDAARRDAINRGELPDNSASIDPQPAFRETNGPGSQLVRIFRDEWGILGCGLCYDLATRMDSWGISGCRREMTAIIDDIRPRARDWLTHSCTVEAIRLELRQADTWGQRLKSRALLAAVEIGASMSDRALNIILRHYVRRAINAATDEPA